MQLSSRILTALAVLILAVTVVAVRAGSPETVEAATGDISVLNVGTCYTTNTDAFGVGNCNDGDTNSEEDGNEGYDVAGRDSITKADSIFATYAIDPKTSGDQPRAILKDADLIKISIEDKGRDKRTGKIYAVSDTDQVADNIPTDRILDVAITQEIVDTLSDLADELLVAGNHDDNADTQDTSQIQLTSATAFFDRLRVATSQRTIGNSGDAQFRLTGDESTNFPMAPDGKIYWFGTVTTDADDPSAVVDLGQYIDRDEDFNPGTEGSIAPWMRVTAALPANVSIDVQYIYYQTSELEEIIGGKTKSEYMPLADGKDVSPVFFDDENLDNPDNQDALILRVSSDGNTPTQNLHVKEKASDRFSGIFEGYIRLTDADGNGSEVTDGEQDATAESNWGLATRHADDATDDGYAVIGVESGPVTITYKNSKGDTRSISITIDKDAPTIQVDSPIDGTASTDDSPELIGSFTDGGGSGLREDSFKIYADNKPSAEDAEPVWDLGVLYSEEDDIDEDRGRVCVDAIGGGTNEDESDGACDDQDASSASLRSQYFGYDGDNPTYGIIYSNEVYLNPDEETDEGEDVRKATDAEEFEDGDVNGEFDTIVRIDFPPSKANKDRYNDIIDIQAVVMDVAGNIGFSDADPSAPTFIHDLGTAYKDRSDKGTKIKHNVLGVYSRHTYYLDDVDPYYKEDQSATGFFIDGDGDESRSASGVMVVFDGPLDPATVGVGTFDVELDGGSGATVVDAAVDGKKVYLLLEQELAPDSTPSVDLASGQTISDLAGNESTDRRLDGIELSDGILPTFTVTLSGGTGLNEDIDGEGSSELTKSGMKFSISANETIQGAPQFGVVCDNLHWDNDKDATSPAKFASNRTGAFTSGEINMAAPDETTHNAAPELADDADVRTMCGDHEDDAVADGAPSTYFDVARTNAHRRAGNNWEYDWSDLSGDQEVEDGTLVVIVWGRDRSSYMRDTKRVLNYSASSVNFDYDTDLMTAWADDKQKSVERELVPDEGDDVFEVRPFVLLDFGDEGTTVDVTTFEVDGTDYTADLLAIEDNEFVWWPEPLSYGTYEVYVEANDAADNTDEHTYSFTVKERAAFVLDLLAGWNSISFPANPIDRALHAVFTNAAIDQVIGWNVTEPVSPWRMATRVDGVWTTNEEFATLNDVEARYGYWVHSTGFITQAVDLAGKGDRSTDGQPNPSDIPTDQGWNFVGVVDVDGDQTQDDAGETLRNSNNDPITAAEYLGNYTRAYTWDHINNTWDVVKKSEGITIGTGVWVYYTSDHDIAP